MLICSKSLISPRSRHLLHLSHRYYYLYNQMSKPKFFCLINRSYGLSNTLRNVTKQHIGLYSTRPNINNSALKQRHRTVLTYVSALAVATVGLSYAAVPLYRMFCQATGLGGTVVQLVDVGDQIETMSRKPEREITIKFNADTSQTLQWRFKPQQSEIKLVPGETALAFYKAENLTDTPITGISTYNVIPFEAGQYFNKIQCFCFEEQRLNPHEEVDMPVFFYIDSEITEDPHLAKVDTITLSYTFFEAKETNGFVPKSH